MARRICDLMTGQISTNNTVTFEGYVHCAAVMIKGMLEDQAVQLIYMAKGRRGEASYEECFEVSKKKAKFRTITIQRIISIQFAKDIIQLTFRMIRNYPAFRSWDGNYICTLEEVTFILRYVGHFLIKTCC